MAKDLNDPATPRTIIDYKDDDAETEAAIYTLQRLARKREKEEAEASKDAKAKKSSD